MSGGGSAQGARQTTPRKATGAALPEPGQPIPLVEAKLSPPRVWRGLIERPQIGEALDAGADARLILVAAPPGYGKTTAVRVWSTHRSGAVAWITLDAGDNDPSRLWRYVATAVDRVREGLGRNALRRLSLVGAPAETPVDELMNGVAAYGQELVIVLDELQAVTEPDCLGSIGYAIERLPPNARIVAVTRADPDLRLARLRARGALAELRAADLAFTFDETRELLVQRGGLELRPAEVEALWQQTEGWPAALVLALLWLRRVPDVHAAVREFGGDQRFVAEYLSEEVLASLDSGERDFLVRAAVLGRFTAALCDAVLGRRDSASVIAGLERSNPFMVPLERGGWFRVHPLVAGFAEIHLGAVDGDAAARLHGRAAAWLLDRGLAVEAVEHAVAAGDHRLATDILADRHLELIRGGGARTLLRWVQTLPDDRIGARPELASAAATAGTMIGGLTRDVRRLLGLVDRARAEHPGLVGPYTRSGAAMVRAAALDGGVRAAVEYGRAAVEAAEEGADEALVAALGAAARACYFAGDMDGAWSAASRAVAHPDVERRAPGHAFAHATLALVALERGAVDAARTHAQMSRSILKRIGSSRSWLGANAAAAIGVVLAAQGELADAERELASAVRLFEDDVATLHQAWILVLLAEVRCRRGRLDDADAAVRAARALLAELPDSGTVGHRLARVAHELAAARGRLRRGALLETPSAAELAVLQMLVSDLSAREIARELFISPNTVRSHTRAIYRKLGVRSRPDAVARASALGLLARS